MKPPAAGGHPTGVPEGARAEASTGPGGIPRAATPAPADDDAHLVQALRAGDPRAFETVVRTYGGRLLAVAVRMLRNEEDAKDAVQESFIAAYRALDRFQGDARLSTWLHRIVVNSALMKLRSSKRQPVESIEDLLPAFGEDGHAVRPCVDWTASSYDEIERAERAATVRRCIDRLPETYRTILLLRDIEELDTREAAQMLGITENGAKIRLHRARQALRALLERHMAGGRTS